MAQHERALRFLKGGGCAIDVGCGSSGRIIELLLKNGFAVEGVDVSEGMLERARARHPEVTFHQADVVGWEFPRVYDFISAWDSVWHVPLGDQEAVLRKLCGALAEGGVLIYTTGGVDEPGDGSNPFLGQPLYHAALGLPNVLRIIGEEGCVCRHLEYDQAHGEAVGEHVYLIIQKS